MNANETDKLQAYLQSKFSNTNIRLIRRPKADDSVEVMLANEFIGLVYKDDDEGEISYQFQMAIIEEDLG
ncbi:hypothetical protein GCM10017044_07980 [Kordiimonas sediminis]|uniref:DUF3126 family protein n=1 Tax=Kordiimonas sediminis TaxID=1735581 RepID=A0A919AMK5_9PROT|nr:DUF3126 family protein [Kordiimonas sediminis]GHF16113.1 hypothetical protein GCM10017044_07980 [Kordiimonas sediminis]